MNVSKWLKSMHIMHLENQFNLKFKEFHPVMMEYVRKCDILTYCIILWV